MQKARPSTLRGRHGKAVTAARLSTKAGHNSVDKMFASSHAPRVRTACRYIASICPGGKPRSGMNRFATKGLREWHEGGATMRRTITARHALVLKRPQMNNLCKHGTH